MASLRSLFAFFAFFAAFVASAPAVDSNGLAARDTDVLSEIVQYFQKLDGDVKDLTSGFKKLAGEVGADAVLDAPNLLKIGEDAFNSNVTIQQLINELNPAGIDGNDIQSLVTEVIGLARDLLLLIPTALSWIVQAKDNAQGDVKKLLSLPHEFVQFVLQLLGQLTSKIPTFGSAIQAFFNLLQSADNTLYNLL